VSRQAFCLSSKSTPDGLVSTFAGSGDRGFLDVDQGDASVYVAEPPTTEYEGLMRDNIEINEEFKEFLEASKQEYLREQAARMAEEESIRQAMRLSLMDLMGTGHN